MTTPPFFRLIGCLLLGSCVHFGDHEATRSSLISNYASVLAANDTDRDDRLSRAEVEAMVELVFPKDRPLAVNSPQLRDLFIADYAAQDTNEDGYLTMAELMTDALASFDCMDTNTDQRLSRREIESGMSRCPSNRTYGGRIGFISEPEIK